MRAGGFAQPPAAVSTPPDLTPRNYQPYATSHLPPSLSNASRRVRASSTPAPPPHPSHLPRPASHRPPSRSNASRRVSVTPSRRLHGDPPPPTPHPSPSPTLFHLPSPSLAFKCEPEGSCSLILTVVSYYCISYYVTIMYIH